MKTNIKYEATSREPTTVRKASRNPAKPLQGRGARLPAFDHPALMEARTIYPSTVRDAAEVRRVLKSGYNSSKLGAVVRKKRWRAFPIYSLTLEERATCPRGCRHWRSCYGNNIHLGERVGHGPELERRVERELGELAQAHPEGFVVRLHVLGDFYSVRYVEFWRLMLERHSALRVFGYTARIDYDGDPIAKALIDLIRTEWERFAVRLSNAPSEECSTISVEHPFQVPPDAILCPAQVDKTANCASCALCWHSKKRIAFLQH